jgi:hypothetical protein
LIKQANTVIFADAFLSNRISSICSTIMSESTHTNKVLGYNITKPIKRHTYIFKVESTPSTVLEFEDGDVIEYKNTNQRKLHIFESSKFKMDGKIQTISACSKWLNQLDLDVCFGKKIYIFCSSKKMAKILEEKYNAICLVYTSEHASQDTSNVNDSWKNHQMIITTSKITIGIDCQLEFDCSYAYVNAGILTRDVIQSLYRIRNLNGNTYCFFENRTRGVRDSVCMSSIYKNYIIKLRTANMILNSWESTNEFDSSLESTYSRIKLSSLQERAFNVSYHKEYALRLFKSQGYTIINDSVSLLKSNVNKERLESIAYKDVKLISEEEYKKLLEEQKKNPTFKNNILIKKYIINLYTIIDILENKEEIWSKFIESEYRMNEIKSIYNLMNQTKEWFIYQVDRNLVSSSNTIIKKDIFDKVIGWFQDKFKEVKSGIIVTKEDMRELYTKTKDLNSLGYKLSKYNESNSDNYKCDRINAFFSNILPGLKLKAPEKRERKQINKIRVDITPYIFEIEKGCDFSIIKT